jgi:hypothetical protein
MRPPLPEINAEIINADNTHPLSEEGNIKNGKYNKPLPNIRKSNTH